LPIIRNAVRVESNKKAIRLLRGWFERKAGSTSSVPLEVSSGGVIPASINAEFNSSINGSSAVDIALLYRQQCITWILLISVYCLLSEARNSDETSWRRSRNATLHISGGK
jgi:hypothetical protein